MVVGPLYALAVFVIFLTNGGPEGAGAFGVVIVVAVTVLAFAPIASFLTQSLRPVVVGTLTLLVILVYFALGLWLWFPVATGLVAASIVGPPPLRRRMAPASVGADDDRLDALE